MSPFPITLDVAVPSGTLGVATAGAPLGEASVPLVLAVHGITGTHHEFATFARHLGPRVRLVAPDLRGRGASAEIGPPHGIDAHVADLCAVLDAVAATASAGAGPGAPAIVLGHSMGAFIAARLAAAHPDRVASVVLVDGGVPLPFPPDVNPDATLAVVLGPALARLGREFASVDDYLDIWRKHPAFVGSPFSDDIVANAANDLVPMSDAAGSPLRPRFDEAAIRVNGRELFDSDATRRALAATSAPTLLLWAVRGIFDEPRPGLDDVIAAARALAPHLVAVEVPDTNHYQIMLGDREAAFVAARTLDLVGQ